MKSFGKTEKVIFTIAVLLLGTFSYFMYDDSLLFPQEMDSNLETVGSISQTQNDVRRKSIVAFSWHPMRSSDQVFLKDSIYTGSSSSALIQLKNGSQINVEPNSLITLNMQEGELRLDLKYGDLKADLAAGSSLTIKAGDEVSTLQSESGKASKIEIKKTHGGLNLRLKAGNAKVKSKQGLNQELASDQVVAMTPVGVTAPSPPRVELITPQNAQFLKNSEAEAIPLEWKLVEGQASQYEIEVAKDPEFSEIVGKQKTNENKFSFPDLSSGSEYFWRVKALDFSGTSQEPTSPHQFTVSLVTAPAFVTPAPNAKIQLEMQPAQLAQGTAIPLRWQAHSSFEKFDYQIALDPEFTQIIKEENTKIKEALSPRLKNGNYYIRLRAYRGETPNEWTSVQSFSVNLLAKKEQRPPAPVLVSTEIDFNPPPPSERDPAQQIGPQVTWEPVKNAKAYRLQISATEQFGTDGAIDFQQNNWTWTDFKPGIHYIRVFTVGQNGLLSQPSQTAKIQINIKDPVLSPIAPISLRGKNPEDQPQPVEVKLAWSEVPFSEKYIIEISNNESFESPLKLETSQNSLRHQIDKPGTYFIRVQGYTSEGQPLGNFSNRQPAVYDWSAPLPKPILREPFQSATIFLQKAMEPFVWLEWKPLEEAKEYFIEVSLDPQFKKKIISQKTTSVRFLLKQNIPLGKVYWRVKSFAKKDNTESEWSETREFTIMSQKNESFTNEQPTTL